jgi:hypothetical protein
MHDPSSLAFQIGMPWKEKPNRFFPQGYRPPFITVWHLDPERGGDDDSCDWFGSNLDRREYTAALDMLDGEHADMQAYFRPLDPRDAKTILTAEWRRARRFYKPRPWYRHPRWHIWHWRLQVHPLQAFCRWMWSRCVGCGGRFRWGYSPISDSWGGGGPRLFKGEPGVRHHECSQHRVAVA